ncbi:MAG: hypothetical protein Q8R79_08995 [Legionellaceae bacterium]|nr:hypothetical protein [Legionellaceae bacterium]
MRHTLGFSYPEVLITLLIISTSIGLISRQQWALQHAINQIHLPPVELQL